MPEKSTMTIPNPSQFIGLTSVVLIQLNIHESGALHDLEYKFSTEPDSAYATALTNQAGPNLNWSVEDYDLARKIPNSTTGEWTLRLTTKLNGTSIGTDTATVTLVVPNDDHFRPEYTTFPTISPFPYNPSVSGDSALNGVYITGVSKVQTSGGTAVGKYGATIVGYKLDIPYEDDVPQSATTEIATSYKLKNSGYKTIQLYAIDSRGYWSDYPAVDFAQVYDYAPPSFSPYGSDDEIRVGRCSSSTATQTDKTGDNLLVRIGRRFAPLGGSNTCHVDMQVQDSSGAFAFDGTIISASANEYQEISDHKMGIVSSNDHFHVIIVASDLFGNSSSITYEVYSKSPLIVISPANKAIGLGGTPAADGLDCYLTPYFRVMAYFASWISVDSIRSRKSGDNSSEFTRLFPVASYNYVDLNESSPITSPSTFCNLWLAKVCDEYASAPNGSIFIGRAHPSSSGMIAALVYNMSEVQNGLPRYSTGVYIPYGSGVIHRFGTIEYDYFLNTIYPDDVQTGTLTYVSNNIITSAANLGMTLKKSGKVVTLNATSTTVAGVAASSLVTVANLPSGFYPSGVNAVVTAPQQSTTAGNIISLYATTDGLLRVIKIGTSTAAWRATLMWITA